MPGPQPLTDDELTEVVHRAFASAGRLPRHADLFLAGLCADHIVAEIRAAGLAVIPEASLQPSLPW